MSTAALLCTFLRIKNRAKTQDTNFVQKSFNPNARFLILFIFSLFNFFYFFSFYFLDFPFLPPHEGAYLIGLSIHKLPKTGFILFFTHRCLLDWAYDPQAAKTGSHPFFTHIGAYLIGLTIHKLPKAGLTLFHFSFFFLDLTLTVNSFKFLFFHLDLPSSASSSNCHFFIWTYL